MKLIILFFGILFTGCGYSARDSEMVAQVKKVYKKTPILCSNWNGADLSLGVIRNGVGSMSSEDNDVYIPDLENFILLQKAASAGQIVKVHYDNRRLTVCVPDRWVTSVEILK